MAKVCPECGRDLDGIKLDAHYREHYPEFMDPARTDPRARAVARLLRDGGVSEDVYLQLKDGDKPDELRQALKDMGGH